MAETAIDGRSSSWSPPRTAGERSVESGARMGHLRTVADQADDGDLRPGCAEYRPPGGPPAPSAECPPHEQNIVIVLFRIEDRWTGGGHPSAVAGRPVAYE